MDRKKALDQLRIMQAWHEDNGNGPNADYDAICYAIGVIEAQPKELDTLIKALEQEHKKLREMQKAQPEIIRCKDCRHYKIDHPKANGYHCCYRCYHIFRMKETDFCSRAERRTE